MAAPDGLSIRGTALWDVLAQDPSTPAGVLALEACRTADRLDELDRIIAGKGVLDLLRFRLCDDEGTVAEVKFDNVMAEVRQQQNALRQMLVSLGMKPGAPVAKPKGSPLDELRAKREARGGDGASVPDAPRTTRERAATRRRR